MKTLVKPLTVLGLSTAVMLATPLVSSAQMGPGVPAADPWAHMVNPAPNGQCWIPNDRPYMEFGRGYWGACPKPTAAASANQGYRARAQAVAPRHHKRYR